MKFPSESTYYFQVDMVKGCMRIQFLEDLSSDPLKATLVQPRVMEKLEFL